MHFEQVPLAAVPANRAEGLRLVAEGADHQRLFWSMHSEVACREHAPAEADSRWGAEGWAEVPVRDRPTHFARYQCQHCSPTRRPVRHVSGRISA